MDESDGEKKKEEEKKRKFDELLNVALKELLKEIVGMLFPNQPPIQTLENKVPPDVIQRQNMAEDFAKNLTCDQLEKLINSAKHRMAQNDTGSNPYNVWKHICDIIETIRKDKGCP